MEGRRAEERVGEEVHHLMAMDPGRVDERQAKWRWDEMVRSYEGWLTTKPGYLPQHLFLLLHLYERGVAISDYYQEIEVGSGIETNQLLYLVLMTEDKVRRGSGREMKDVWMKLKALGQSYLDEQNPIVTGVDGARRMWGEIVDEMLKQIDDFDGCEVGDTASIQKMVEVGHARRREGKPYQAFRVDQQVLEAFSKNGRWSRSHCFFKDSCYHIASTVVRFDPELAILYLEQCNDRYDHMHSYWTLMGDACTMVGSQYHPDPLLPLPRKAIQAFQMSIKSYTKAILLCEDDRTLQGQLRVRLSYVYIRVKDPVAVQSLLSDCVNDDALLVDDRMLAFSYLLDSYIALDLITEAKQLYQQVGFELGKYFHPAQAMERHDARFIDNEHAYSAIQRFQALA